MLGTHCHLGLEQEPLPAGRVVGVAVQHLHQGHLAMQFRIQRDEDGAQATLGMGVEHAEALALAGGRTDGVRCRAVAPAVLRRTVA
jgi:hypothetical protein